MLSIIIPCYNEAGNLPLIFSRLKEIMTPNHKIEIILVNNGSIDYSNIVFAAEMQKSGTDFFRVVEIPKNQGYGYGILAGLEAAKGDVLAWTHADMQTDPSDIITAYSLFLQKNDLNLLIKGKRCKRNLFDKLFSFGMQAIASLALKTWLNDINAQPKLFSRRFYQQYIDQKAPHDFSLDLYVLYCAVKNNIEVIEIPVFFNKRKFGEAKGGGGTLKNKYKLVKRTLNYILELRRTLKVAKRNIP